ncbi:helix-turn-helix domain-containing protein [Nakamurella sp.]|uniref:helix-turn-helix domain-containing protein n=1 Tax=Nakamurella sp. TaxID=1869182 RepID=UPI003B3A3F6B
MVEDDDRAVRAGSENEPVEFGQLLREYRLRAGLSQQRLAEAVFGSARKSSISELETIRSRVPQPHTQGRLCEVLGLTREERREFVAAAERRRQGSGRAQAPSGPPSGALGAAPAVVVPGPTPEPMIAPAPVRARPGSGRVLVAMAGGLAVAVAAVTATLIVLRPAARSDSSAGSTPASTSAAVAAPTGVLVGATVMEPLDRQAVQSPLVVRGVATVAPDQRLWLLVHPVRDTRYYVSSDTPISIEPTGRWATRPRIGRGPRDEGYEFDLILIVSPVGGVIERSAAELPPDEYSVDLAEIPDDSAVVNRLRVTLSKYNG